MTVFLFYAEDATADAAGFSCSWLRNSANCNGAKAEPKAAGGLEDSVLIKNQLNFCARR